MDMGRTAAVCGDEIEGAVANPGFGHQRFGECPHGTRGATQDDALHAIVVIQMSMQGRHAQIMMLMLGMRHPLRQFALMVVIHVGQVGDAVGRVLPCQTAGFNMGAQDVAHRLRTVRIAPGHNQGIKGPGQVFIEGYGKSLHGQLQGQDSRTILPAAGNCRNWSEPGPDRLR